MGGAHEAGGRKIAYTLQEQVDGGGARRKAADVLRVRMLVAGVHFNVMAALLLPVWGLHTLLSTHLGRQRKT